MKRNAPIVSVVSAALVLCALLVSCDTSSPPPQPKVVAPPPPPPKPVNEEMKRLAQEVYIYAYPLVLMDVTKQVATARTPINTFAHRRALADPTAAEPNTDVDTLQSTAWLDLSKEPMIISVPDTKGRYYVMSIIDGWTNVFASPGKRLTGTDKAEFAIVGPKWKGTLPPGVEEIHAPTEMAWVIVRMHVNGKADVAAVNKLQDQFKIAPLSRGGKKGAASPTSAPAQQPRVDTKSSPAEQVAKMDARTFFTRFALLLPANPPTKDDAPMVEKMKRLGIVSGQPFDPSKLDAPALEGIDQAPHATQEAMAAAARGSGGAEIRNGWLIHADLGRYGVNYGKRAFVAWTMGLGHDAPEDTITATARLDGAGQPLDGANAYVVHFDSGKTPPTDAFWSITAYNDKQLFTANPIERYAIGSDDKLARNPDGSIDIYVQNANPGGDKSANWLPVPKGKFYLTLRTYWPKPEIAQGRWAPPPVRRAT